MLANDTIQTECKPRETLEGKEILSGTKFKDELLYGAQKVTVDGAATLKLLGAHLGKTLGVSLF